MPVCLVFAVGLDGKCGTGEQRLQGGADRDWLPAAAAPASGTTDSDIRSTSALRQAKASRFWHARVEDESSHEWLREVLPRATEHLRRGAIGRYALCLRTGSAPLSGLDGGGNWDPALAVEALRSERFNQAVVVRGRVDSNARYQARKLHVLECRRRLHKVLR